MRIAHGAAASISEHVQGTQLPELRGASDDALADWLSASLPVGVTQDAPRAEVLRDLRLVGGSITGVPAQLQLPCLARVQLTDCAQLLDAGLEALLVACPALQVLEATHCPALRTPRLASTSLRRVILRGNVSLRGDALIPLLDGSDRGCSQLRALDISGCLEVEPPLAIGATPSPLTELHAEHCCAMTWQGATVMLRACPAMQQLRLTALRRHVEREPLPAAKPQIDLLHQCINRYFAPVAPVVDRSIALPPRLLFVSFALMNTLDDEQLTIALRGATVLRELDLKGCSALRSPRISCAELRFAELAGCSLLRVDAVRSMVAACPRLDSVGVRGCSALGPEAEALVAELIGSR